MNKLILILSLIFCGINIHAQDDNKIAGIRKEYLTKELALTPTESDAFFPVYNEYIQKKRETRRSLRSEKTSSDNSVNKIIDLEQNLIDLQREYLEKFRKILPEKKIVQLLEAEKKFKTMMIQRLKD
jgi:AAA15 family ATPase/GTPase